MQIFIVAKNHHRTTALFLGLLSDVTSFTDNLMAVKIQCNTIILKAKIEITPVHCSREEESYSSLIQLFLPAAASALCEQ